MATTRELFEQVTKAFNAHDRDAMAALTAEDAESFGPGGMTAKGKQAVLEFNIVWLDAFPDARVEVGKTYIDGDVAIEEGVFTGTHTGVFRTPMGDIPPTNKSVRGEYVGINEFRDGKVIRQLLAFDRLQLMEQLGLVPEAAGAGA